MEGCGIESDEDATQLCGMVAVSFVNVTNAAGDAGTVLLCAEHAARLWPKRMARRRTRGNPR